MVGYNNDEIRMDVMNIPAGCIMRFTTVEPMDEDDSEFEGSVIDIGYQTIEGVYAAGMQTDAGMEVRMYSDLETDVNFSDLVRDGIVSYDYAKEVVKTTPEEVVEPEVEETEPEDDEYQEAILAPGPETDENAQPLSNILGLMGSITTDEELDEQEPEDDDDEEDEEEDSDTKNDIDDLYEARLAQIKKRRMEVFENQNRDEEEEEDAEGEHPNVSYVGAAPRKNPAPPEVPDVIPQKIEKPETYIPSEGRPENPPVKEQPKVPVDRTIREQVDDKNYKGKKKNKKNKKERERRDNYDYGDNVLDSMINTY